MVRKQLYIEERQERALKRRAKALGISGAELVRRALDHLLEEGTRPSPRRLEALDSFLDLAATTAGRGHRLEHRPQRDTLYDEREERLVRR